MEGRRGLQQMGGSTQLGTVYGDRERTKQWWVSLGQGQHQELWGSRRRNSRSRLPREDTTELRPGAVRGKEQEEEGERILSRSGWLRTAVKTTAVQCGLVPFQSRAESSYPYHEFLLCGDHMVPYPKSTVLGAIAHPCPFHFASWSLILVLQAQ